MSFDIIYRILNVQRGIKPEELPPAEDIKKVERRVAKDEKNMQKDSKKLPKSNEKLGRELPLLLIITPSSLDA